MPWCNFPWLDTSVVGVLAERFTVVVASPRGYAQSTRLSDRPYRPEMLAEDLLAICSAAGFERFSIFGYSLTAAIASWLAVETGLVDAVVAGGFPLLGSYGRLLDDVEAKVAEVRADERARSSMDDDFDVSALLAFYQHLATLPDGALVDRLPCPMLSFCGDHDEVVGSFGIGVPDLGVGLKSRGVDFLVLTNLDHLGTLLNLSQVQDQIVAWLLRSIS